MGNLKPGLGRHVAVFDFDNRRYEWRVGSSVRWSYSITDSEYDEYAVAAASPAPWPILIFGAATKATGFSSNNRSKCRIYGVKLYRAGVLKHDYAPCVKGGGPGFRDRVDGAFITGDKVSAFKAGGDVEQIEDDACVSTSGNDQDAAHGYNKFFSTGYVITDKTRVELDYALADNYKGDQTGLKSISHPCIAANNNKTSGLRRSRCFRPAQSRTNGM